MRDPRGSFSARKRWPSKAAFPRHTGPRPRASTLRAPFSDLAAQIWTIEGQVGAEVIDRTLARQSLGALQSHVCVDQTFQVSEQLARTVLSRPIYRELRAPSRAQS